MGGDKFLRARCMEGHGNRQLACIFYREEEFHVFGISHFPAGEPPLLENPILLFLFISYSIISIFSHCYFFTLFYFRLFILLFSLILKDCHYRKMPDFISFLYFFLLENYLGKLGIFKEG